MYKLCMVLQSENKKIFIVRLKCIALYLLHLLGVQCIVYCVF